MRARTNISTKEKRSFTISNFRGADFSSSPMHVQPNRAIDMTNWICENGTNQKRPGWAQVLENLPGRINGVFPYAATDGKTELLVHAGASLYRLYESGGAYQKAVIGLPTDKSITDERSQAFYRGGYLYLTCGSECYLCYECETGTVKEVEPYIPTTTINIDHIGVEDTVRASLDPVNLLTTRRKNTLVGEKIKEIDLTEDGTANIQSFCWLLDGCVLGGTKVELIIDRVNGGSVETITCYNMGLDDDPNLLYARIEKENGDSIIKIIGHFFWDNGKTKIIINNFNTEPPVAGEANITVIYTAAERNNKAFDFLKKIENCRFGTLFGVGGNEDRLFLSGNPDYPNVVFFSEANDFTYFPDTFTATLGTDQSAVTGFLRLSDNTLATFKEYSDRESSVYYQTGEYRSFYDDDGNLKKIIPVFSITAGATGESAVNPYVSANLAGDNLILSQNGVFAIEPTSNVLTDTRTARERSYAVRERLIRHGGIKDAAGIVYKGRYYLSMDGVCYVADSRYKYQPEDSLSYNYEWWYWDHIPARVWAVVDGALWFGTADGRICRFDGRYTDRTFETTVGGDLTISVNTDTITYNKTEWNPRENDCFTVQTEGAYAKYAEIESEISGVFGTNENDIWNLCEGDEVCRLMLDGTAGGELYTVTDVDRVNGTFALMQNGERVSGLFIGLSAIWGCYLLMPLCGKELLVTDVKDGTFSLKFTEDGKPMDIMLMGNNTVGRFERSENVVARWYTPYFDMGTNESAKTLLKLTVSQLPGQGGKLSFGYDTALSSGEFASKGTGVFSFDTLDFTDFSFGTGFQNSYSVKVKERNFNYIMFRFLSDSDKVCSINDLTAIYKINKRNLGVV